ncbi:MAG: hypothetical protein AAGG75_09900 [Bacteroidota bacterium]
MLNNNLIQILRSFSRKEMTRFCDFVHSPYFNKHEEVRALIRYLSDLYPKYTDSSCQREVLFQRLFPEQLHDQAKLALLFTYSLRLLERFLTQEELSGHLGLNAVFLLRNLRQRKQHKYYERVMRQQEKRLTDAGFRDSEHFNLRFLTAEEADNYYTGLAQHKRDHSIQLKQNNLDHYYLTVKIRDACEMKLRSKILKIDYSTGLLDVVIHEVGKQLEQYREVPAIVIYYHIYEMIVEGEETYFYKVLEVLNQNKATFPSGERQNIYNYLQNYCIEQINKGNIRFLEESLQLYKDQLVQGLLLDENGYLSEWHYKNIVTVGIRLRDMEWTRQFIEEYVERLGPAARDNAYSFNLAAYYYAVKEYEKVLQLLLRLEYTDIRYNLDAKALLLRTYYDLDEYEAFLSLVDSFRQYVQRNKLISDFQRQGYYNLLKFAKQAFRIKNERSMVTAAKTQLALKQLQESVAITDPIYNLSWLNRKIQEIGND